MKLSFSTRGWNSLNWDQQVQDAVEMSFQGIEPYNIQDFPSLSGKGGAFHSYQMNETMRTLKKEGLSLPCFDTSIDLSAPIEQKEKTEYLIIIMCTDNELNEYFPQIMTLSDASEACKNNKTTVFGIFPSEEKFYLPHGIEPAYDGMRIALK